MRRYILKCAILSTYGQSNNNYKQFRSKLGSNSFIWYITTICLRHVADEYMMNVKLSPVPTRINAILGYPCVMVRNGYCTPIFFLLTSGIVFRTLLGFRKCWPGQVEGRGGGCTRGVCSPLPITNLLSLQGDVKLSARNLFQCNSPPIGH